MRTKYFFRSHIELTKKYWPEIVSEKTKHRSSLKHYIQNQVKWSFDVFVALEIVRTVVQLKVTDRKYCAANITKEKQDIFNRPGVAGAVLQTPLSFIDWLIN